MGTVYVVHCIDTEGPLYEDKDVVFEQIQRMFGAQLEPQQLNKLDVGGGEVYKLLQYYQKPTKGSWDEIDEMLDTIMSVEFRNKLKDSAGKGWVYSWFCMDHVGFWGKNPRRRDAGHHKIYDHYNSIVTKQNLGDVVQFHHHPVSISGNYHDSATAYWGKDTLNQILARKIIDRNWFPCAYRPGFHTERPDSNWFLEQWIPFDYGNQATDQEKEEQVDFDTGRFGNWSRAPKDWFPYHPSHDDYQIKGNCRRWITRCLNMKARIREICQQDVDEAFRQAVDRDTILAFTDHDYKDMVGEIERVREMISEANEKFPSVSFRYSGAVTAMQKVLNLTPKPIGLNMTMDFEHFPTKLAVCADRGIFGPQPFLAIKTKSGDYYWDNFDFNDKNKWSYTFDNNTVLYEGISDIGIAANNSCGVTEVVHYYCAGQKYVKQIYNC